MRGILVTFYGCSLQTSRIRHKLEAEGPGHDQLGRKRWDRDLPNVIGNTAKVRT